MKKNMGLVDRTVRITFAVIVAVLFFNGNISGLTAIILGVFAVIFLITGIISFCPIYLPFGINTINKRKSGKQ